MILSQETLRRLADRAPEVLERHKDDEPFMGVFVETLGQSAPAFIEAYDKSKSSGKTRRAQTWLRHASTIALLRQVRGWATVVCMYIPTHPRSDYGTNPDVPEDVMKDVADLVTSVDDYEQEMGETLSFSAKMRTELASALATAKLQWGSSVRSHSNYAKRQTEAKAAAIRFYRDLVAFRRALATAIGRAHPDYRRLRTARVAGAEEVEELVEVEEGSANAVIVATAPVSEPGGNPG